MHSTGVTYVSEQVLPMSPVYTPSRGEGALVGLRYANPTYENLPYASLRAGKGEEKDRHEARSKIQGFHDLPILRVR